MKESPQRILPILPSKISLSPWLKEKNFQVDDQQVKDNCEQLEESHPFFDEFSGYKSYRQSSH